MGEKMNLFICKESGTIVEELYSKGNDECFNQKFSELKIIEYPTLKEKHIPQLSYHNGKLFVTVGEIPHPMVSEHYITFVEVRFKDYILRKFLQPGESPSAEFDIVDYHGLIEVFIYCNIHGLWKNEIVI